MNLWKAPILITGSNGFIGSRLAERLSGSGVEIRCLDLDQPRSPSAARSILGDITQPETWEWAMEGVETVFHLAGKADTLSKQKSDESEYFRVNTEGTRRVLELAKLSGVKRFVFFSTIKAMSRSDPSQRWHEIPSRPWNESDYIDPDTPYGRSKRAAEQLVLEGGYVQEPVVLRLCPVYGRGNKGYLQQMLAAVHRRYFPPLPNIPNRRSMIHVLDVLEAAILASTHPAAQAERFIVSDGRDYSTHEILALMHDALGMAMPRWHVPTTVLKIAGRLGDWAGRLQGRRFLFDSEMLLKLLGSAWYSSEKIQTRLGFRPQWDLAQALAEMIAEL